MNHRLHNGDFFLVNCGASLRSVLKGIGCVWFSSNISYFLFLRFLVQICSPDNARSVFRHWPRNCWKRKLKMFKGTTPTIILTLPNDIDLGEASNVYVSFATRGGNELIRMTGTDISIDENVISVFLSQEETLKLPEWITIQVNWTYAEGTTTKRAASKKCTIHLENNIINEVLA